MWKWNFRLCQKQRDEKPSLRKPREIWRSKMLGKITGTQKTRNVSPVGGAWLKQNRSGVRGGGCGVVVIASDRIEPGSGLIRTQFEIPHPLPSWYHHTPPPPPPTTTTTTTTTNTTPPPLTTTTTTTTNTPPPPPPPPPPPTLPPPPHHHHHHQHYPPLTTTAAKQKQTPPPTPILGGWPSYRIFFPHFHSRLIHFETRKMWTMDMVMLFTIWEMEKKFMELVPPWTANTALVSTVRKKEIWLAEVIDIWAYPSYPSAI